MTLDLLACLIHAEPMTARQIADTLGCSKPTAYKLIRDMRERGDSVFEIRAESKRPGPRAVAYGMR